MTHVVAEGGNFTIACVPPRGKPTPAISWKDQFNETIRNVGSVSANGYRLIIVNARKEYSGKYTCRAENTAGFVESSFNLIVAGWFLKYLIRGYVREINFVLINSISSNNPSP